MPFEWHKLGDFQLLGTGNSVLASTASLRADTLAACRGRASKLAVASVSGTSLLAGSSLAVPQLKSSSSGAALRAGWEIHSRICARPSSERRRNLSPPHFFAALSQATSPHASICSRRLSE